MWFTPRAHCHPLPHRSISGSHIGEGTPLPASHDPSFNQMCTNRLTLTVFWSYSLVFPKGICTPPYHFPEVSIDAHQLGTCFRTLIFFLYLHHPGWDCGAHFRMPGGTCLSTSPGHASTYCPGPELDAFLVGGFWLHVCCPGAIFVRTRASNFGY